MSLRTLFCMTDAAECRDAMSVVAATHDARFCATPSDVVAAVQGDRPPAGIVWSIDSFRLDAILGAVRSVCALNVSIPHLFRVSLDVADVRGLCAILGVTPTSAIVSLRGHDRLADDIRAMQRVRAVSRADAAIISQVASAILSRRDGFVSSVVIASVLIGRRPTRVTALARALGVTVRALRQRMRNEHLMNASTLLRWTFVLHSMRAAEVAEQPLKAIAKEAGFKSAESVTNRLARLRGVRFRDALLLGGFTALLAEFGEAFILTSPPKSLRSDSVGTLPRFLA